MPRVFVNGLANFSIQGGMVSFTLQDQALRSQGGVDAAAPEDVIDLVMREQDFAQFLQILTTYTQQFEQQMGRSLGTPPQPGPQRPQKPTQPTMTLKPKGG